MKFKLAFILVLACLSLVRAQEHGQDDCTICPGNTGKLKRSDAPIPPRTKGCSNAAFIGFGSLFGDSRFDPCCNRLTACYLECNVTKTYCDADFFKCMLNVCGINTAPSANGTNSDIPDTDGTGSFANFTGTSGNLSCRDKAVCHAGYVKGNEWCDKYDDIQHDYCYCRAGYPVPVSQPVDAIPLPGYTGGNAYCFSDGVSRVAAAVLPQPKSTGAQSFGKAMIVCLVLFISMAVATRFTSRKEKQ